ncbi:hypothetical protein GGR56DRAFT_656624 [Xylariaceae sp. FL0804]|nr:hypothetical protein GGR56DRAFT_656624 [Xylariaceae sp. FL0804]
MAGKVESGGALPKRKLMTYGKGPRKRQPKTAFTPVTASESMSDDDPITASTTTQTRRRPSLVSTPHADTPTRQYKTLSKTSSANSATAKPPKPSSSDRKRKLSQVYKPQGRAQGASAYSDEESSPSASEPRRVRMPSSNHVLSARSSGNSRAAPRPASTASMDVDGAGPRLSSPPLTPTPPKSSRPSAEVESRHERSSTTAASKGRRPNQVRPRQQQIPFHLARNPSGKASQTNIHRSSTIEKALSSVEDRVGAACPPPRTKKRLIDALAQQAPGDTDIDVEADSSSQALTSRTISSQSSDISALDVSSLPATPRHRSNVTPAAAVRTYARSGSALKFTYGQGSKVLQENEDDLLESLILPEAPSSSLKGRRLELGGPEKQARSHKTPDDGDLELGGTPGAKLKDIHELRQAGANSWVADTMQDLRDQMGTPTIKPSSSRRAALLQIAEKIHDRVFLQDCRNHGAESDMLRDLSQETDNISGFLILSSLLTIMAKAPSTHIVKHLALENSGPFFARLLGWHEDIKKLVRDRKSNLSKRSQASIIGVQNGLRELSVWDGAVPSVITPRGTAIKCLQLVIKQDSHIGRDAAIFTPAVTEQLFGVLSHAVNDTAHWDYPQSMQSIDFCSALSILHILAGSMAEMKGADSTWLSKYLPVVADVFDTLLRMSTQGSQKFEEVVLKLTIDVTNNNLEAPDVFASKGVLAPLAFSISHTFTDVLTRVFQDGLTEGMLDSLVLRQGLLMNFLEHSPMARQVVGECEHECHRPVDELIRLFLENHRRTSEADSMEKSHLNVAFGWLYVLLGYLALYPPVRQKLKSSHPAKSIGPLIDSIREFSAYYSKIENPVMEEAEDGSRAHNSTEQLQNLVRQLEDQAVFD